MAEYNQSDLWKTEVKRPNYFTSQLLVEADFNDEQTYHREMRYRHNAGLHTYGVVTGLQITQDASDKTKITVSPGIAVDGYGHEIVLAESADRTRIPMRTATDGDVYIVISYEESFDAASQYPKSTDKYTRWSEKAKLEEMTSRPDDGGLLVILARVRVDTAGSITEVDYKERNLASSVIARGSNLNLGDVSMSGSLSITGDGRIGIGATSASDKLTIRGGALSFQRASGDGPQVGVDYDEATDGLRIRARANAANAALDTTLVTIKRDSGNVGIGTPAWQSKLTVAQDINATTNHDIGQIVLAGATDATKNKGLAVGFDTTDNYGFIYAREQGVSGRNLILNPDSGNVGIGTTDLGSSKFKVARSSTDFVDIEFADLGAGRLRVVGWGSGWNINAMTAGKNLHINRDADSSSNVLIGCFNNEMVIRGSDGSVGIGTGYPPGNRLEVRAINGAVSVGGQLAANQSTGIQFLNYGKQHAGFRWSMASNDLILEDASSTGNPSTWYSNQAVNLIIRNGSVSARGIEASYSDLAENYLSDLDLAPGDVVCLDRSRDRIVLSGSPNDALALGVVSTEPGVLLNSTYDKQERKAGLLAYPVAICGRVPCKVTDENGPVERGDLLTTSSTPGHAMKATPVNVGGVEIYRPATIIGKALEALESGKGIIEAFIALS
jgi:hypothetical protein